MAIPSEILAVERPKSTVVKKRGDRYVVIKRTSKRVGKRCVPVDLGMVGEIVNGKFVERQPRSVKKQIDIKDYGEVTLCDKVGNTLLDELTKVWDLADAKRLYVLALLRAAYGDVKNRDLQLHYETSFASEMYPGVHLSEQAVSAFLQQIGQAYSLQCEFMRNRADMFAGKNIVIDGMLKDYNSAQGSMSEFSRKARTKGSKDLSLMYAFDPESGEPIAARPYPGNMLDQTCVDSFVSDFNIEKGLMIFDKGFWNEEFLDNLDAKEGVAYLIPLKQNSAFIKTYGMDNPTEVLEGYTEGTILYKKVEMKNGKFLYSFRDPKTAYEQEVGYVQLGQSKGCFDSQKYEQKRSSFGLIVFKSKADLDPLIVYLAYAMRWLIEILFNMYKNIMERDTVNVHSDYRVYATELINFLSAVIRARVKRILTSTGLSKKYSCKQIFKFLSKYKKVRTTKEGKWQTATMLKYIEEVTVNLGV